MSQTPVQRNANTRLLRRLLLVAAGAFVFAFSMVPLYRIACEEIFGIKLEQGAASAGEVAAMTVDRSRLVTVQFDANLSDGLAWQFAPRVFSMQVHPGELAEAWFSAENSATVPVVGQAVPSIAPNVASVYFNKTECFCFTEQLLKGGEKREMPVRFVIDPKLPAEISTITLSYKFFLNDIATRRLTVATPAAPPASS